MRRFGSSVMAAESVKNRPMDNPTVERAALFSCVVSFFLVVVAAWLGGERSVSSAYYVSIGGGCAFAALCAYTCWKSFKLHPPVRLTGWIFLHLCVWSIAFALEQFGWFAWRHAAMATPGDAFASAGLVRHFEYTVSPILKVIQGTALLGLLGVVWMIRHQANATRLRSTMMAVWAAVMTFSAIVLGSVAFFG